MNHATSRLAAALAAVLVGGALLGAAPAPDAGHFPPATISVLPNGVIVTAQISNDSPIAGAQVFVPAGLMQQTALTA
ncbi:MAG TPA: hypothetical protein VK216_00305, partial [Magnetospirillaceae bacterium]|nr:hypothetical protein [Magnetospirillaceae bacterium]